MTEPDSVDVNITTEPSVSSINSDEWVDRKTTNNPRKRMSTYEYMLLAAAAFGPDIVPFLNTPISRKQIGYKDKVPEPPKPCLLPGCDNLRSDGKLYCSGAHCKEHDVLIKEQKRLDKHKKGE